MCLLLSLKLSGFKLQCSANLKRNLGCVWMKLKLEAWAFLTFNCKDHDITRTLLFWILSATVGFAEMICINAIMCHCEESRKHSGRRSNLSFFALNSKIAALPLVARNDRIYLSLESLTPAFLSIPRQPFYKCTIASLFFFQFSWTVHLLSVYNSAISRYADN